MPPRKATLSELTDKYKPVSGESKKEAKRRDVAKRKAKSNYYKKQREETS